MPTLAQIARADLAAQRNGGVGVNKSELLLPSLPPSLLVADADAEPDAYADGRTGESHSIHIHPSTHSIDVFKQEDDARRHSFLPSLHLACYAHWPVKTSIRPPPLPLPLPLSSARGRINQPDRMETMHHQKVFGIGVCQAAARARHLRFAESYLIPYPTYTRQSRVRSVE